MKDYLFIDGIRTEKPLPLRSLFYGEGLFETFRYKGSLPVLLDKHFERMEKGAILLKIPFPDRGYLRGLIRKAISESEIDDAYVKLCLLSDGDVAYYQMSNRQQVLVIVKEYVRPRQSVKLKVSSFRRISDSPLIRVKSINYLENILARRDALNSGYDESLFVNENGEVTECSSSNIFWFKSQTLFTPNEDSGLLTGTTRALVLDFITDNKVDLLESKFLLNDMRAADFVFITNSLIGCMPVSEIEGNSFNTEHPSFLKIQNTLLRQLEWV